MKNALIVLLFLSTHLFASELGNVQVIRVMDKNNETVTGAKVELLGSGKTYYTNSKGECYIPIHIFEQYGTVKVECISYKSATIDSKDIQSKIVLESR